MGNNLKFNSSVCTNREQSQRLLDLGLKPETADCMWCAVTKDAKGKEIPSKNIKWYLQAHTSTSKQIVGFMDYTHIPAWSLHRLIELLPQSINLTNYADTHYYLVIKSSRVLYMNDYKEWLYYNDDTNYYNRLIDCIRWTMEQKLFNKEYLKQ